MKVQLEKTFAMPASADATWATLQDIERLAGCMPGARITERVDPQHYKGAVVVKFGPATMSFRGDVEVASVDAESRTLRLVGKGTDTTGGSGAAMDLTARVEAVDAASCTLVGHSEVSVSGKAAAFGARMMNAVADQVLKQFGDNLAARLKELPPPGGAGVPAGAAHGEVGAGAGGAQGAGDPGASAQDHAARADAAEVPAAPGGTAPQGASNLASAAGPGAAAPSLAAPDPKPLNGFALLWAIVRDWLRSLFTAKRA